MLPRARLVGACLPRAAAGRACAAGERPGRRLPRASPCWAGLAGRRVAPGGAWMRAQGRRRARCRAACRWTGGGQGRMGSPAGGTARQVRPPAECTLREWRGQSRTAGPGGSRTSSSRPAWLGERSRCRHRAAGGGCHPLLRSVGRVRHRPRDRPRDPSATGLGLGSTTPASALYTVFDTVLSTASSIPSAARSCCCSHVDMLHDGSVHTVPLRAALSISWYQFDSGGATNGSCNGHSEKRRYSVALSVPV
jgi:hypothetical protein